MELGQHKSEQIQQAVGFTANTLKIIAIIAMAIDHIAWLFAPPDSVISVVMHFIGRITGPTMFYFAAEGYRHTRNLNRYLGRLFVFALISYFPFIFCFSGGNLADMNFLSLNVIFTIFLGVLAIRVRREIENPFLKVVLLGLLLILSIPCDWGTTGFLMIVTFDFYRGDLKKQAYAYILIALLDVGLIHMLTLPFYSLLNGEGFALNFDYYRYMVENLGVLIPILLLKNYSGERGGGPRSRWIFYIFYPLHLLLLGLTAMHISAFA